jgi:hypothetical protein
MRSFFVETQEIVDRVLIFEPTGMYMDEMKLDQLGQQVKKIATPQSKQWLGFVPVNKAEIMLILLGGEMRTNYLFNDLFSIPLTLEELRENPNDPHWHNHVIINTPQPASDNVIEPQETDKPKIQPFKLVLLEAPQVWSSFWNMVPVQLLQHIPLDKLKMEMGEDNSNYIKHGIDPQGLIWLRSFDFLKPRKSYLETFTENSLDKLLTSPWSVCCYFTMIKAKYTLSDKGNKLEIYKN